MDGNGNPIQPPGTRLPAPQPDPLRQPAGKPGRQTPTGAVQVAECTFVPAGFWLRFWAFLIDFAVLALLHQILVQIAGIEFPDARELLESLSMSFESILSGGAVSDATMARMAELNRPAVISGWLNIVLCSAYYTVFHGMTGQTLGKLCLQIRVLRSDGSPLGIGWAGLRYLCYLLSSRLVYTAWVIPLDRQKRTAYDMLLKINVFRQETR